jgi:phenylacetate-CoA ligase
MDIAEDTRPAPAAVPRSQLAEIAFPAVVDAAAAQALALQYQLAQSQWWPPERLRAQQFGQLALLLRHARETVPHYAAALPAGLLGADGAVDPERWPEVPILARQTVQEAGDALASRAVPPAHGRVHAVSTSGATGMPVTVGRTALAGLFWNALTLRDHLWHRRDFGARLAVIRYFHDPVAVPAEGSLRPNWGPASGVAYETGPCAALSVHTDIAAQAAWLVRQDPDYLLSYPSNLEALAQHFAAAGLRLPRLREIRSVSEMLRDEVRTACREAFGVPVSDIYSTQEAGYLALQCPGTEHYHVMAEDVLLEILDDAGRPCAPGETGRVVITPLHNFATVLLRYDLGDFAEAGAPCACGRGLPVIRRILGRTRNMAVLPDGRTLWPRLSQSLYRSIALVRQVRVVQRSLAQMEFRYVAERALTPAEEAGFIAFMHENFAHPFAIAFARVDALPRSAGGKFEDFVCEVPRGAGRRAAAS